MSPRARVGRIYVFLSIFRAYFAAFSICYGQRWLLSEVPYKMPSEPMKALRVLVAEDDTVVGMLLGELLQEMGYDVCAIETTGADAVAAAARCRPDLMIVDVRLGDGSGVSAVEEILRAGPVPYLFVSGDISSLKALRPGTVAIQKPYRAPDLAQAIQRAVSAGTQAKSQ